MSKIINRDLENINKLKKLETQKKIEKNIINDTDFFLFFNFFSLESFEISILLFFEDLDKTILIISNNL